MIETYTKVFSLGKTEHLFSAKKNETLCGRFGGLHSGDTVRVENGEFFIESWNRNLGNIIPSTWSNATESDINNICQHCKKKALKNEHQKLDTAHPIGYDSQKPEKHNL